MSKFFKLRGTLDKRTTLLLEIGGVLLLLGFWSLLTVGANPIVPPSILPAPWQVLNSYGELFSQNDLLSNTTRSIALNLIGYSEAVLLALPIGFIIGLFPLFRGGFKRHVEALRFIPLTAVTGLFIIWFGIETPMKAHFLAFGIFVYLLPVVVQRIDEVKDVYLKTVFTLGATSWQTIRTVYIPSVLSRIFDDIRVLTAISWTYIIIAEAINSGEGGIGALIYKAGERQGRVDKVFAILLVIILIGFIQDRLFKKLAKEFFPHKYVVQDGRLGTNRALILAEILPFARKVLFALFAITYLVLFFVTYTRGFLPLDAIYNLGDILPNLFGSSSLMLFTVNSYIWGIIGYTCYKMFFKNSSKKVIGT